MRENIALWMTPGSLGHLSEYIRSKDLIEEIASAYEGYLAVACKPLMATPVEKRDRLPEYVARFAVDGSEARLRLVFALYKGLGNDPRRLLEFSSLLQRAVPEVRSLAAHLFEEKYLECFEMGARIYVRSILTLAEGMKAGGAGPPIRSDHLGKFYEWLHVAGCLDLSASSILWYLTEDRDPARAPIGEELCFLLKEYSVAYGSLIRILMGRERPREPREAGLSECHLRWDSDFCRLTLPDFRKHLAAS